MKKGGSSEKEDVRLLDAHVILTVLICVFVGAIFVLGMIFFGMQIEKKVLSEGTETSTASDVDIIGVSYETMNVPYLPGGNTEEASLLYSLTGKKDASSYVIKTKAEYDSILTQVKEANRRLGESGVNIATSGSLQLDEEFFQSGSVILFSVASDGLRNGYVSSLTRDEKYAITAEVRYAWGIENQQYIGMAIFVKVPNIQPKDITVNYGTAAQTDPEVK